MKKSLVAIAIAIAASFASAARAQIFPSKPITILVGFAPGNSIDIPLRMMLPHLQKSLGQPVGRDQGRRRAHPGIHDGVGRPRSRRKAGLKIFDW